jgi:hypothetical protein
MKHQVREIAHSQHSAQVVDTLFDRPIFRASDFIKRADISKSTAHPLIHQLLKAGILVTLHKALGRKPAIIAFPRLLGRDVLPDTTVKSGIPFPLTFR